MVPSAGNPPVPFSCVQCLRAAFHLLALQHPPSGAEPYLPCDRGDHQTKPEMPETACPSAEVHCASRGQNGGDDRPPLAHGVRLFHCKGEGRHSVPQVRQGDRLDGFHAAYDAREPSTLHLGATFADLRVRGAEDLRGQRSQSRPCLGAAVWRLFKDRVSSLR